jgi:hypothetical protein
MGHLWSSVFSTLVMDSDTQLRSFYSRITGMCTTRGSMGDALALVGGGCGAYLNHLDGLDRRWTCLDGLHHLNGLDGRWIRLHQLDRDGDWLHAAAGITHECRLAAIVHARGSRGICSGTNVPGHVTARIARVHRVGSRGIGRTLTT